MHDFEFHVSRKSRDKYQFDKALFGLTGNVVFADFKAVRLFAEKMNAQRDTQTHPEGIVMPGDISAMGLIDEILHLVCSLYREQRNEAAWEKGWEWLTNEVGEDALTLTLSEFVTQFPYQDKQLAEEYAAGITVKHNGALSTCNVMEEMLLLYLANINLAFSPFLELFDDAQLRNKTVYQRVMTAINDFFQTQPVFGPAEQSLIDMLRAPAIAMPNSLLGQLEYIRNNWSCLLPESLVSLILRVEDIIKEDEKLFLVAGFKDNPPPLLVLEFGEESGSYKEYEKFSRDIDWMPNVVLLAKNTYVWLHQLSVKYHRAITHLDHIPDEELDMLSQCGFTALWLIGIWERSPASQRIKQICGNPEAVSSAYSVYDYTISEDIGGDAAFENLKSRAWQRGIRLAGDMVPNHMGIFSKWVIEHPDYFIQVDYSPFHVYRFTGPDLSWDRGVSIFLEDGYWSKTDAAVVFKRVDHRTDGTNETKYIYHGNDGTHMPWNDTAQLDFLKAEVREAVIQTILHVARKFSIIRFDAAMTLAKKHFQRLWYPQPGSGGDIPSRAEHGLRRHDFDAFFPEEFWREVVDRIAVEVPDTLLIAEAFWLMEGYFVRTLGMHRVYNSAFMHMLKAEENQKYRNVLKNVLEFNPQILKRFVNFMNNPDEDTSVSQFGKDDKYFGTCVMLATLPGLPMFGHGQIEGFAEKYGMEYQRSYWDEPVDEWLVERHKVEIFPLLKKRCLFSDVKHFVLYDFYTASGSVNENVFAYSNCCGRERALVVYNNKYDSTCGWISSSTAINVDGQLVQHNLAQGLAINKNYYYTFRDYISGLEYIRHGKTLVQNGIYVELDGFKYHVFLDFEEIQDDSKGTYAKLTSMLNGQGVSSIGKAYHEMHIKEIQKRFEELTRPEMLRDIILQPHIFRQGMYALLGEIRECGYGYIDETGIVEQGMRLLSVIRRLLDEEAQIPQGIRDIYQHVSPEADRILLLWLIVHRLGRDASLSVELIDEWQLSKGIIHSEMLLIKILVKNYDWFNWNEYGMQEVAPLANAECEHPVFFNLKQLFEQAEVRDYLQMNQYQGVWYVHKESLEDMLYWLALVSDIHIMAEIEKQGKLVSEVLPPILARMDEAVAECLCLARSCAYQVEKMSS
ncbi:MAG: alpha-amylase family glycosyl hydrolase [bacterium]|nr:alpha-amylase family glycosyl hydrolase [bacterium]